MSQEVIISYTAVAPAPKAAISSPKAATSPSTSTPPVSDTVRAAPKCVSRREVKIHVADHLTLPARARIKSALVLLSGRVVGRLKGSNPTARLTLVGLPKGAYTVAVVARISTGKTLKTLVVFHTCTAGTPI
jgi:hypothetical protein